MFKAIDRLLFKKGEIDGDTLSEFSPYMVTRYLSFYDKNLLTYANDTLNRYGNLFSDKVEQAEFFDNVIPKLKMKRISYVSKKKEKVEKEEVRVPEFYSKREIEYYENQRS